VKKIILMLLATLMGRGSAHANVESANKLTQQEKQQIANAIKILSVNKVISNSQSQCVSFDEDILDRLEAEGYLEQGDVQPSSICIGPGSK